VSVLIFGAGGGVSIYEGILHVLAPEPATNLRLNFIVFGLATLFESISLAVALRGFTRAKGRQSTWQAVRRSKDPTMFVVPFEDSAALVGFAVAALGVFLSHQLQMPVLDGVASIVIGTLLCVVVAVLLRESKGLLVGESAEPAVLATIRRVAGAEPAVTTVGRVLTMHLGPEDILVNIEVQFRHAASSSELAASIEQLEGNLRNRACATSSSRPHRWSPPPGTHQHTHRTGSSDDLTDTREPGQYRRRSAASPPKAE
jgi:divalent metal cation (Fe/Co/Zn/Cd) transporter